MKSSTRWRDRVFAVGLLLMISAVAFADLLAPTGAVRFVAWVGVGAFFGLLCLVIWRLFSFCPPCPLCRSRLSQLENARHGPRTILVACHACRIQADTSEFEPE